MQQAASKCQSCSCFIFVFCPIIQIYTHYLRPFLLHSLFCVLFSNNFSNKWLLLVLLKSFLVATNWCPVVGAFNLFSSRSIFAYGKVILMPFSCYWQLYCRVLLHALLCSRLPLKSRKTSAIVLKHGNAWWLIQCCLFRPQSQLHTMLEKVSMPPTGCHIKMNQLSIMQAGIFTSLPHIPWLSVAKMLTFLVVFSITASLFGVSSSYGE